MPTVYGVRQLAREDAVRDGTGGFDQDRPMPHVLRKCSHSSSCFSLLVSRSSLLVSLIPISSGSARSLHRPSLPVSPNLATLT